MGFKAWSVSYTNRTVLRELKGTEVVTFTSGILQNTSERKSATFAWSKGFDGSMPSLLSLMLMTELIIYILRVLKYPIIVMQRVWHKQNLQSLLMVGSDDKEALLNGLLSKKFLYNLVRVNQVYLREHMHGKKPVCPNENTDSYLFIDVKVLLERVTNGMVNHT